MIFYSRNACYSKAILWITFLSGLVPWVGHSATQPTEAHLLMQHWISQSWAINNTGQDLSFDLGPARLVQLPGVKGSDLKLPESIKRFYANALRTKNFALEDFNQNLIQAWTQALNAKEFKPVTVAVFDTGIDSDHPLLRDHIATNASECGQWQEFLSCLASRKLKDCQQEWLDPKYDVDRNQYPLDCRGWSFTDGRVSNELWGSPDTRDTLGHGTHVAGIIRLINPWAKLLPIKIIGEKPNEPLRPFSMGLPSVSTSNTKESSSFRPRGLPDFVALSMRYAALKGAKIFHLSLGWPPSFDTEYFLSTLKWVQNQGILVIAAAGNDNTASVLSPCIHSGVICVGATRNDGSLAYFSNFGLGVDTATPGVKILSTWPMALTHNSAPAQGLAFASGTSQSAPWVSGIAAWLMAASYSLEKIRELISTSSQPLRTSLALRGEPSPHHESPMQSKFIRGGHLSVTSLLSQQKHSASIPRLELETKSLRQVIPAGQKFAEWSVGARFFHSQAKDWQCEWEAPYQKSLTKNLLLCQWDEKSKHWLIRLQWEHLPVLDSRLILLWRLRDELAQRTGFTEKIGLDVELFTEISPSSYPTGSEVFSLPLSGNMGSLIPVSSLPGDPNEKVCSKAFIFKAQSAAPSFSLLHLQGWQYVSSPLAISAALQRELSSQEVKDTWCFSRSGKMFFILLFAPSNYRLEPSEGARFLFFDEQGRLVHQYSFFFERTTLSGEIYWLNNDAEKLWPTPVWIQTGQVDRPDRLWDHWRSRGEKEKVYARQIFYLSQSNQLRSLSLDENYQLQDLQYFHSKLGAWLTQKNSNSLCWSGLSRLNNSTARASSGEVELQTPLCVYSHLPAQGLETLRRSRVIDLASGLSIPLWYSSPFPHSFIPFWTLAGDMNWATTTNPEALKSERLETPWSTFDSTLVTLGGIRKNKELHLYSMTNSWLQYHVNSQTIAWRSLERFSFFPSQLFVALHFPVVVENDVFLFIPEGSRLGGVKWIGPYFADGSSTMELLAPVHLRFMPASGCRSLDNPLHTAIRGNGRQTGLDFICEDRLVHVPVTKFIK